MKTLYHGSDIAVKAPLTRAGRSNLDFGRGFYLTQIREQAESRAQIIASRKGRRVIPILNVYSFDDETACNYRYKHFDCYDLEWLDYVIDCRQGGSKQDAFDIIEGGVANDNVIDTVEDYEKGIITAEQALGQLRYKKVNHQLCIRNQEIIDKCLKYIESVELRPEED